MRQLTSCFRSQRSWPVLGCCSTIPQPVPRENPERVPRKVGLNLRALREIRGWTQAQAAMRLGITARTLQRYEAGWKGMTIFIAARLAAEYKTPTWALFHRLLLARMPKRRPGRPRKNALAAVQKAAREADAAGVEARLRGAINPPPKDEIQASGDAVRSRRLPIEGPRPRTVRPT